jgi:hypothetical protein
MGTAWARHAMCESAFLEVMSGELWAPGKPSFTKPYCGKRGSAATDLIIPSYSWDNDEETNQSPKPKKTQTNGSYS